MKHTFTPELKKTRVRKILENLVDKATKIQNSYIPNGSYSRVYMDVLLEETESEIQKLMSQETPS